MADNLFIPGHGCLYTSPVLTLHYIACHHYLPPAAYIAAVMDCPDMSTLEYWKRRWAVGGGR